MNKYKCRFKTEQELIDEFGTNWNQKLYASWRSPNMDYLLGTKLKLEWYEECLGKNGIFKYSRIYIPRKTSDESWSIKINLLKVIKSVDYNEKRILVYD